MTILLSNACYNKRLKKTFTCTCCLCMCNLSDKRIFTTNNWEKKMGENKFLTPLMASGPFALLLPNEKTGYLQSIAVSCSRSCKWVSLSNALHHRQVPPPPIIARSRPVSAIKWWGERKGEDEKKREQVLKEHGWWVSSFDAACRWSQLHQLFVHLEGERKRQSRGDWGRPCPPALLRHAATMRPV